MGNTMAYAQEQNPAKAYGPGVRVENRSGGNPELGRIEKDHRYVECHYKGALAGNYKVQGKGPLDIVLVRQLFDQLGLGDTSADCGKGEKHGDYVSEQGASARNNIVANGPAMSKNREAMLVTRQFAPLGTGVLKCLEKALVGTYGENGGPEAMAYGESFTLKCSKEILSQDSKKAGDLLSAPARGFWNKRQSTAGAAKFQVVVMDSYKEAKWLEDFEGGKVNDRRPSAEEMARRGITDYVPVKMSERAAAA